MKLSRLHTERRRNRFKHRVYESVGIQVFKHAHGFIEVFVVVIVRHGELLKFLYDIAIRVTVKRPRQLGQEGISAMGGKSSDEIEHLRWRGIHTVCLRRVCEVMVSLSVCYINILGC